MKKNAIYAQSGGVTSVINASAYGVLSSLLKSREVETVYAAKNGIDGILKEEIFDISLESRSEIEKIPFTPGGIFGSCRTKINDVKEIEKIFRNLKAHNIGYFFYNGGNDSMETAYKLSKYSEDSGEKINIIGVPKTVDNDLCFTDHCPGFGSAAKFTSVSLMEAARDLKSMASSSTKIFILESMGRHAGWLSASSALCRINEEQIPLIILFPEVRFEKEKFLAKVENLIENEGFCAIVVSEGVRDLKGEYLSAKKTKDSFGNVQLGKVSIYIEDLISSEMKLKCHTSIPDYLQRSSRHLASYIDWKEAVDVGAMAVSSALKNGISGKMISIERILSDPYLAKYVLVDLKKIGGETKYFPEDYLSEDKMDVNDKFYEYASPLISGEAPNMYIKGIPLYSRLMLNMVQKKNGF